MSHRSAFQTGDVSSELRKRLHRSLGIDVLHFPTEKQKGIGAHLLRMRVRGPFI
jgi:hypothetical protein